MATKRLSKEPRERIQTISDNHVVNFSFKEFPWPLRNRQFVGEQTWIKRADGSYVYSFRPTTNSAKLTNVGKNSQLRMVRAESRGFLVVDNNKTGDSCKVIYLLQIDMKGNIPTKVMEATIPRSLGFLSQTREKFNRDEEIDKVERERLVEIMRSGYEAEQYEISETGMIDSVVSKMATVPKDAFQPLESLDFRTKMR